MRRVSYRVTTQPVSSDKDDGPAATTRVDAELRPLLRAERFIEATTLVLRNVGPEILGYLSAVLVGRRPPELGEPVPRGDDDISGRLAVIEHQLREITDRLRGMSDLNDRLDEINASVETVLKHVSDDREMRRR